MRIRVINHLDDLADDTRHVAVTARRDMVATVRRNLRLGNKTAKGYARESAGAHGKHYHKAFSTEMHGLGSGISGEYGPDAAKPQGNMSFESGSRNQPPHNDLAKSHDQVAPLFHADVGRLPERWFW